jgi:hypothetical protein
VPNSYLPCGPLPFVSFLMDKFFTCLEDVYIHGPRTTRRGSVELIFESGSSLRPASGVSAQHRSEIELVISAASEPEPSEV